MPQPISVFESRKGQIAALCSAYAGVPLPRGLSANTLATMLEVTWEAGYETGRTELRRSPGGGMVNINKERIRQCFDAVNGIGTEDERLMELIIHVWTAGLLSTRDEAGVPTPQHPNDARLDRVKVDRDGRTLRWNREQVQP